VLLFMRSDIQDIQVIASPLSFLEETTPFLAKIGFTICTESDFFMEARVMVRPVSLSGPAYQASRINQANLPEPDGPKTTRVRIMLLNSAQRNGAR